MNPRRAVGGVMVVERVTDVHGVRVDAYGAGRLTHAC